MQKLLSESLMGHRGVARYYALGGVRQLLRAEGYSMEEEILGLDHPTHVVLTDTNVPIRDRGRALDHLRMNDAREEIAQEVGRGIVMTIILTDAPVREAMTVLIDERGDEGRVNLIACPGMNRTSSNWSL